MKTKEQSGRGVVPLKQPVMSMDDWVIPKWIQDATCCVDQGDLEQAAVLLTEDRIQTHLGQVSMPEKGFVLVVLARLFKRMCALDRAESLYDRLMVLCPSNTSILNEIACSLEQWGRSDEAVGYITKALEIDPHDSRLWDSLVRIQPESPEGSSVSSKAGVRICWCGGELANSIHPAYGRCKACRTFVLRQQLTPDELTQFYTFKKYWHTQAVQVKNFPPIETRVVDDLRDRIPVWYGWLCEIIQTYHPSPNYLFEIGCSHGGFLAYCRKNGLKNVVGNEPDKATCAFAKKLFGLPFVVNGLFPDVLLPFDQFGIIAGFDVFEHMPDPVKALSRVCELLSDQGICLFQIPCYRNDGAQWQAFKPPEHIYLYDSENVHVLFNHAGLEVLEVRQGCFKYDSLVVGRRKRS